MISTIPFVSQQPTGMLVVGDALIVAGELDMMVFDMSKPGGAPPPLLATCGAACSKVGKDPGQNFHSVTYKLIGGKHLIFISAQIDNNVRRPLLWSRLIECIAKTNKRKRRI